MRTAFIIIASLVALGVIGVTIWSNAPDNQGFDGAYDDGRGRSILGPRRDGGSGMPGTAANEGNDEPEVEPIEHPDPKDPEPPPADDGLAPLDGVLILPGAWAQLAFELTIIPNDPTLGDRQAPMTLELAEMEEKIADPLTLSWSAGRLHPGLYRASIRGLVFDFSLEETGLTGLELLLPEMRSLTVRARAPESQQLLQDGVEVEWAFADEDPSAARPVDRREGELDWRFDAPPGAPIVITVQAEGRERVQLSTTAGDGPDHHIVDLAVLQGVRIKGRRDGKPQRLSPALGVDLITLDATEGVLFRVDDDGDAILVVVRGTGRFRLALLEAPEGLELPAPKEVTVEAGKITELVFEF